MAFFSKIKALFSPKRKVEVNLNDVEGWLNDAVAFPIKEIEESTKEKFLETEHLVQDLNEAIDNLANAKLRNENIEEKLKNYMTGNRDNYIRETKQLISWIEIPKTDVALDWCTSFLEKVNGFNKSSFKSYRILQEFFADEASKIASVIKDITGNIENIKNSLTTGKIKEISDAKKQVAEFKRVINRKDYLSKRIEDLTKKKEDIENGRIKKEAELKRVKESEGHKYHEDRIMELKDVNQKIKKVDESLTEMFSPLKRAMSKYTRIGIGNVALITAYDDYLKGLMNDPEFKILEVLKNMRISIMKKELDIDEEEREKVIKKINDITQDKLEALYLSYKMLIEKRKVLDRVVSSDPTIYQIGELNRIFDKLGEDLILINNEINSDKDEFNKINLEESKTLLQEVIGKATDSDVVIV